MSEAPSPEVLAERYHMLRVDIATLTDTVRNLNASLSQMPVVLRDIEMLGERGREHTDELAGLDGRVVTIEQALPGLLELRRWVIGGILASMGLMGTALFKLAVNDPTVMAQAVAIAIAKEVKK